MNLLKTSALSTLLVFIFISTAFAQTPLTTEQYNTSLETNSKNKMVNLDLIATTLSLEDEHEPLFLRTSVAAHLERANDKLNQQNIGLLVTAGYLPYSELQLLELPLKIANGCSAIVLPMDAQTHEVLGDNNSIFLETMSKYGFTKEEDFWTLKSWNRFEPLDVPTEDF